MKMNWDQKTDNDYEALPAGKYEAQVESVKNGQTPTTGTPYTDVFFKVVKGDKEGRTFKDRLWLTEKNQKRIALVFSRLGLEMQGQSDLDDETFGLLIGRRAIVTVQVSEDGYNQIPFAGYEKIESADESALGKEDLPF